MTEKKVKKEATYKTSVEQYGKTNQSVDKLLRAKPAGWRLSKNGNWYYERRKNRSDSIAELRDYLVESKRANDAAKAEGKENAAAGGVSPTPSERKAQPEQQQPLPKQEPKQERPKQQEQRPATTQEKPEVKSRFSEVVRYYRRWIPEIKVLYRGDTLPYGQREVNMEIISINSAVTGAIWRTLNRIGIGGEVFEFIDPEIISLLEELRKINREVIELPKKGFDGYFRDYNPASQKYEYEKLHDRMNEIIKKLDAAKKPCISPDDKDAIPKLKKKLETLKSDHERYKRANAYYRKHKTTVGCPDMSKEEIDWTEDFMRRGLISRDAPFSPSVLSSNIEDIHRVENRIKELEAKKAEQPEPKPQQEPEPKPSEEDTPVLDVNYYSIDESLARRAKESYSFSDYKAGSATNSYEAEVEDAAEQVQNHMKRVDPMYHDKINAMFDTYCKRLAAWNNKQHSIDASCPSVMIVGGSGFNNRKKEKQLERWRAHANYYDKNITGYLQKILSVGLGGISSDDKDAITKLKKKLETLKSEHERFKRVNAYYRKHKTEDGCPDLSKEEIEQIKDRKERGIFYYGVPFPSFHLSNNLANIHRIEDRIKELEAKKTMDFKGWSFEGGEVVFDKEDNRIRILFNSVPSADERTRLKRYGFRWSPKNKAWQRQITRDGIRSAEEVTGLGYIITRNAFYKQNPKEPHKGDIFILVKDDGHYYIKTREVLDKVTIDGSEWMSHKQLADSKDIAVEQWHKFTENMTQVKLQRVEYGNGKLKVIL